MQHLTIKNALLALNALALAFILGQIFWSLVPGLSWPYSVVAGYGLGLLAGGFESFVLLGKWQRPAHTKIITAIILIAVAGAVNMQLQQLNYRTTIMGIEMQELRDNAARP